jgi:hypothetical protein
LLLGFFVQLRAQVPAAMVHLATEAAVAHLQRLTQPGRWQPGSVPARQNP